MVRLQNLIGKRDKLMPVATMLRVTLLTLAVLLAWAGQRASFASGGPSARGIMEQAFERNNHATYAAEVEMVLIDQGGGERSRRMKLYSKRQGPVSKRTVFFTAPPDIRGTAFLSVTTKGADPDQDQTEQWIYFPGLGKIKRIAAGDQRQAFMGSDLTYSDMARRGLAGFKYRLLRQGKVRGHPVWLIEALPESQEVAGQVGYSKAVYLVRQDNYTVVRAINWLLTANQMRYLDVLRLEEVDGVWTPLEVQVWTTVGKKVLHKTILRSSGVRIGLELPDGLFSKQGLERGQ